jgi:hypothetical protein
MAGPLPFVVAWICACAEPAPPTPPPVATDLVPGRRTPSPDGGWEAVVAEGGALSLRRAGRFGEAVHVDDGVDARVAFSPDGGVLVYARRGDLIETDLWRVDVPDGRPVRLTDWPGTEDRPVVSPDGRRVAFVSSATGIAAWWVADLDGQGARQVTNVGLPKHRPGVAPEGWVPVPDGHVYAWGKDGLTWVAGGKRYAVTP